MQRFLILSLLFITACSSEPAKVSPGVLSFAGTKTGTIDVQSKGSWTLSADQTWLSVSKASGDSSAPVTVTVNRTGLAAGNYSGTLKLVAGGVTQTIRVFMRFPSLSGNVNGNAGKQPAYVPSFDAGTIVPDSLELLLEPGGVAVSRGTAIAVDVEPAPSEEDYKAAADQLAADYKLTIHGYMNNVIEVGAGGQALADLVKTLSKDGRVRSASPVSQETSLSIPNDPLYAQQWHYPLINLPAAWDITLGSANVPIAIVDSGVEVTHPDLQSRVILGYDFTKNSEQMSDLNGHGTHCAGTVGAATNNGAGVAGVTVLNPLIPVRVLGDDGTGSGADITRGLLYAAGIPIQNSAGQLVTPARAARVINASLGANDPQCTGNPRATPAQFEVMRRIEAAGTVVVFAAGNDGPCNAINEWGQISSVISVTAVGPNGLRAPYSTAGSDAWIAAPGGLAGGAPNGVLSTYLMGAMQFLEGTSMAAPHVAGVVGLMLSVNPSLTPLDVRTILAQTARAIAGADAMSSGAPNQRGGMGFGLVDAAAAVAAARDWTASRSNFRAQLVDPSGMVVQTVPVDAGGNFTVRSAPAGSFKLRVGNDPDGDGTLGESGEEFDEQQLTLGEDSDTEFDAALHHVP